MSVMKDAACIGIIGGADGPTAIFVTGGFPWLLLAAAVAAAVGIAALLIWRHSKKK